jgi:predicted  nucleic acid-binding Zn-ribbon protein
MSPAALQKIQKALKQLQEETATLTAHIASVGTKIKKQALSLKHSYTKRQLRRLEKQW